MEDIFGVGDGWMESDASGGNIKNTSFIQVITHSAAEDNEHLLVLCVLFKSSETFQFLFGAIPVRCCRKKSQPIPFYFFFFGWERDKIPLLRW